MPPRQRSERYCVTGPGIGDVSYADFGPALSRSLTAAQRAHEDATYYVRDAITGDILGYSERCEKQLFTVDNRARQR